ncbi:MAG: hypothetical protein ACQETL_05085 [Bacteroidota bacterium]
MKSLNKLFLLIILIGCSSKKDEKIDLPDKIAELPVGIKVTHNINTVYASINEDPTRGGKYKWLYQTSVTSLEDELEIVEFGGYVLDNGKWIEKNVGYRPFNNKEFEKWYNCQNGILTSSKICKDKNNWTTADRLTNSKNLWYYIGKNKADEKFVGYAEIEMIGELR